MRYEKLFYSMVNLKQTAGSREDSSSKKTLNTNIIAIATNRCTTGRSIPGTIIMHLEDIIVALKITKREEQRNPNLSDSTPVKRNLKLETLPINLQPYSLTS